MFEAPRRWFRRNRVTLAVGAGLVGGAYLAGQYVLGKITEARQRMADDRIAKENLRRRFEQNQEDCTLTVLALLPTLKEDIVGALPVERTLSELQQRKAERLARGAGGASDAGTSDVPSVAPSAIGDESQSGSSSFVHASQMVTGSAENGAGAGAGAPPAASSSSPARPPKTRMQLWDDVKTTAITRAFTLLYCLSLLTLLTRIQLNLLGRRNYLSSVVSLATPARADSPQHINLENHDDDNTYEEQAYGNDFETNRQYLAFSWWLLHRGSKQILDRVQAAVKEVFGPINPREEISFQRLSELTLEVRKRVEGNTEDERRSQKWLPDLLPPRASETNVLHESGILSSTPTSPISPSPEHQEPAQPPSLTPALRRLLDETADLIDSPTFSHVLTLLLDSTFATLVESKIAAQAYPTHPPPFLQRERGFLPPDGSRITELPSSETSDTDSPKAKLALLLSVFTKQAHAISHSSTENDFDSTILETALPQNGQGWRGENEYVAACDGVPELQAFAAVVYSSNWEFEAVDHEEGNSPAAVAGGKEAEAVLQQQQPAALEGSAFDRAWGRATAS